MNSAFVDCCYSLQKVQVLGNNSMIFGVTVDTLLQLFISQEMRYPWWAGMPHLQLILQNLVNRHFWHMQQVFQLSNWIMMIFLNGGTNSINIDFGKRRSQPTISWQFTCPYSAISKWFMPISNSSLSDTFLCICHMHLSACFVMSLPNRTQKSIAARCFEQMSNFLSSVQYTCKLQHSTLR